MAETVGGMVVERVYVAGPMTGLPQDNWPAFEAAGKRLRERFGPDVQIILPTDLDRIIDGYDGTEATMANRPSRRSAMMRDQLIVSTMTHIHVLEGWDNSKGGRAEVCNALACDVVVMYDNDDVKRVEGVHIDGGHD